MIPERLEIAQGLRLLEDAEGEFLAGDPDVRRVVTENAAKIYGFDVDALAPVAAKVGPTVDEVAVPLDEIPKDSGSPAFADRVSV